jgi:hypothetical protein
MDRLCAVIAAAAGLASGAAGAQWTNGLSTHADYFPIGVWLQRPEDAPLWLAAGVNLYTGLWDGPTTNQLDTLRAAGIQAIVSQNSAALNYTARLSDGRPVVVGWLMDDEPDNAQPDGSGGYGPPTPPSSVQQACEQSRTNDPSRPVFLNLGQGIGWDSATWYGQKGGINPDSDYPQYIAGTDIISFDIYPMASADSQVAGAAWRVALGVDRLRAYAPANHIVWCFIETSDIRAIGKEATVGQIRAEVWMAIIHGAGGINYFIHGKTSLSNFDDRALLRPENAGRLAAVTALNNEVHSLASVLKAASVSGLVSMTDAAGDSPVDFMVKQQNGATYLFAVGMRDSTTAKRFQFQNLPEQEIEVLGENRSLRTANRSFIDTFTGYEAHLYRAASVVTNRLSLSTDPSNRVLSWNSATGVSYTVQFKTNLDQPAWMTLGSVGGMDITTTMTDSNPIEPQRFYRLLSSPMPAQR